MIPVILTGGSGTRLWPLSRTQYPKQFLSLNSQDSMLQETVKRLDDVEYVSLICNEDHRFLAAEQMRQIDQNCSIILEPEGRNTAPAIALAAINAIKEGKGDSCLLVLPADHVIEDRSTFNDVIKYAYPIAREGKLVTFGIVPSKAETGYGYIKTGEKNEVPEDCSVFEHSAWTISEFVEKPDYDTASRFVESGEYLWNSGMFLFRADRYIEELQKFRPDIFNACEIAMKATHTDLDFLRVDVDAFHSCPSESIDYAVMEHTDGAVVVSLDAGWSDVGSWSALWELKEKDQNGNAFEGDVISRETFGSLVMANHKLVTTIGVNDLIIVDTADALLVADKEHIQDVKSIVANIKSQKRSESEQNREVFRPWGKYDSIDSGERYQVKRISVNPGAKLSTQKHHHRAEHWVVVKGTAKVTRGSEQFLVTENQSTYIPLGEIHCLENPGKVMLELIEIQSGSYLAEDDIVRLKDDYGRKMDVAASSEIKSSLVN
ncbi:MAG: mannose-1-phosphate guanylyltransferase/mannose-6-phosphate isomerase [Neptuniibacter sp.]